MSLQQQSRLYEDISAARTKQLFGCDPETFTASFVILLSALLSSHSPICEWNIANAQVCASVSTRHPVNVNLEYLLRCTIAHRANGLRCFVRAPAWISLAFCTSWFTAQYFRILRSHHDSPWHASKCHRRDDFDVPSVPSETWVDGADGAILACIALQYFKRLV